jgi:ribonuclease P protein component
VNRNRVKRWLREAIRRQKAGLTGVDVVFIARRGSATAGFAPLHDEVGQLLDQLRDRR